MQLSRTEVQYIKQVPDAGLAEADAAHCALLLNTQLYLPLQDLIEASIPVKESPNETQEKHQYHSD